MSQFQGVGPSLHICYCEPKVRFELERNEGKVPINRRLERFKLPVRDDHKL